MKIHAFLILITTLVAHAAPLPEETELLVKHYGKEVIHIAMTPEESEWVSTTDGAFEVYSQYRTHLRHDLSFTKYFLVAPTATFLLIAGLLEADHWYTGSQLSRQTAQGLALLSLGWAAIQTPLFGILYLNRLQDYLIAHKKLGITKQNKKRLISIYHNVESRLNRSCKTLGGSQWHQKGGDPSLPLLLREVTLSGEDFELGRVYFKGKLLSLEKARVLNIFSESVSETKLFAYSQTEECDVKESKKPVFLNRMLEL